MNGDEIHKLRDAQWRRELTPDEERAVAARLAQDPAAATDWISEARLARAIRRLPDAPVASNFTSRVMSAVSLEARRTTPALPWWRAWASTRWIPASAMAAVAAVVMTAGWGIHTNNQRTDFSRQVATLRAMTGLSPAVLQDFEAIRRYSEVSPPVDFGLLVALQ
jgi:anti-sigma factor RsiW